MNSEIKNTYGSPRWTGEVADCSMPMTFDTYSNCSFGCLYCFSQFQRAIGGCKSHYLNKEVKSVNVSKIKKMFTDPDKYGGQFKEYIKQRKVMQWGGLSDEFDGYERKYGVTLELLKFFKEINYPLCFSTKAVWFTQDERYMSLIRGQKNWNFKFSIITLDEHKAKIMEQGVPTPKERLQAINRIAEAGAGGATLRLRPFIIGLSTPTYTQLIQEAADAGANALSTEFLCLEQRSPVLKEKLKIFNELCGFDVLSFYKKYSCRGGYLRLNRHVKKPFVDKMEEVCRRNNMRFYVSDAHFKERCDNGSCCGLPSDWNYSRGQFCEALQIAKKKGFVTWDDIREDVEKILSGFEMNRATGFQTNSSENRAKFMGVEFGEYVRYLWNTPNAGQSPYSLFEGILLPNGVDKEGNIIYRYRKELE